MNVLNLNVGLLGHVDSGKTSLAKVLSTVSSTAAFDKNPQSQERGITIDLGFSSFSVDIPSHLSDTRYKILQFTLVDCPGHASLIKTIIGGAHIIDLMLLVIDVTKGIQTQTAECLIIGEIMCKKMIIVLNKIDLLENKERDQIVEKMTRKLKITLKDTIFSDSPVVSVSAKSEDSKTIGIENLIKILQDFSYLPERNSEKPFLFAVDHCFGVKGKGTVLTGTVLQGSVRINDEIDIPSIKQSKKVKSIQMFKKPIESASQGDRIGLCVTQFDPKLLERGIACQVNYVPTMYATVIDFNKIKYFKMSVSSKSKFHVSVGYETVNAKITLFSLSSDLGKEFNIQHEYKYIDEISVEDKSHDQLFVLLEFDKPILIIPNSLTIGTKLDVDIHSNTCRIAFYGNVVYGFTDKNYSTEVLKIYKDKYKKGTVERMVDEHTLIGRNMFKKETNIDKFVSMKVTLSTGEQGQIQSSFGQSGKFKVNITGGLQESTQSLLNVSSKNKKNKEDVEGDRTTPVEILLHHKRYIFDTTKKMIQ